MPSQRFIFPLAFSLAFPLFLSALALFACHRNDTLPAPIPGDTTTMTMEKIDILALGDSYTKGESVPWPQNFPNQLADSLRAAGYTLLVSPRVIAQTGWRTDNLQASIASPENADIADSTFSLVTLCIGVNNQYQNADFQTYKVQFEALLQTAIARAGGRKDRVFVVSIPDYAYTPFGQDSGKAAQITQELDQYNAANRAIAEQYGVHYVNITDVSRKGLTQPELVAGDELHPSAKQYTEWVKLLLLVVKEALK